MAKIRNGFVSNSSSSSFIINKKDITELQLHLIQHHWHFATENEMYDCGITKDEDDSYFCDEWCIKETDNYISGRCSMDNFDMKTYLEKIGVDMSKVDWDGCYE